jgi:pantoate--beta-alanine ligase
MRPFRVNQSTNQRPVDLLNTVAQVRGWERRTHSHGKTIGLVPTMGALHEGHLALVRRARQLADAVALSIFVNPTQFGPGEDLEKYPRALEADLAKSEAEGVAMVFAPTGVEMYPEGFRTWVEVSGLSQVIEGAARPGHFRGVATVVLKLFNIVRPDVAVFGWKDAQQFIILRRMVKDLDLPIRMEPVETVREPDGLALSSRNAYLSPDERRAAPVIQRALQAGLAKVVGGARRADQVAAAIRGEMAKEPLVTLQTLDIVDMETLAPLEVIREGRTLIAISAKCGPARLIDNIRV